MTKFGYTALLSRFDKTAYNQDCYTVADFSIDPMALSSIYLK
ncbi:MAG: hypothetical protein Q4G13_08825 [Moraxella sp.]|nr:hypothetical protein [Moraxella sp.]